MPGHGMSLANCPFKSSSNSPNDVASLSTRYRPGCPRHFHLMSCVLMRTLQVISYNPGQKFKYTGKGPSVAPCTLNPSQLRK